MKKPSGMTALVTGSTDGVTVVGQLLHRVGAPEGLAAMVLLVRAGGSRFKDS
jgi:hypothetical protein